MNEVVGSPVCLAPGAGVAEPVTKIAGTIEIAIEAGTAPTAEQARGMFRASIAAAADVEPEAVTKLEMREIPLARRLVELQALRSERRRLQSREQKAYEISYELVAPQDQTTEEAMQRIHLFVTPGTPENQMFAQGIAAYSGVSNATVQSVTAVTAPRAFTDIQVSTLSGEVLHHDVFYTTATPQAPTAAEGYEYELSTAVLIVSVGGALCLVCVFATCKLYSLQRYDMLSWKIDKGGLGEQAEEATPLETTPTIAPPPSQSYSSIAVQVDEASHPSQQGQPSEWSKKNILELPGDDQPQSEQAYAADAVDIDVIPHLGAHAVHRPADIQIESNDACNCGALCKPVCMPVRHRS